MFERPDERFNTMPWEENMKNTCMYEERVMVINNLHRRKGCHLSDSFARVKASTLTPLVMS